ncbi:hypothetical protein BCR33DRAFT_805534 [Rhizoclosmatium globosum]|uniref:Uncharacterized protein n=1 Tax=Rhizoclosmatium globosum TaxID=329046 RepID=A0A1Y2CN59_9FUNG|nr:hypothetical protein BCR33DRAFT_805534 [Rhizoclosmatium globosum]|eukprot:ORY48264.1 hypothetical protein BCR33DRAFT_805534 [Rhizoclosmatium globosum]
MGFTPTTFIAINNLTKVLFPNSNPNQYAAFAKASSLIQKLASVTFLKDFPELESLFTKYLLPDDQINLMLRNMPQRGWTAQESACDWFKNSQDIWGAWIPPVPKSVGIPNNVLWIRCERRGRALDVKQQQNTNKLHLPFHDACYPYHSCPPLSCAPQFNGILCTECSHPDEYLWGEECHKCNPGGGASFYAIIFVAFLCAFVLLLLPYEEAPTVELLFFYFQVSRYVFETQVQGILKVSGISTFLAITSLNVDGFVSDCTLPISGVRKLLFRFFLPTLIIVYIVVLYFVLRLLQSRFPKTNEVLMRILPHHLKGDSVSLICFRAIIIAFTFIIMPMVDSALLLLQCTTVEGRFVLTQVPQVECFGSEHAPAAALAIIIIIWMLGVLPALLGVVLYLLKKNDMIIYEEEGLTPLQKLFQCLYIIFKPEMFFMMPITILEKGLVSILFSTMARYSSSIQTNTYIMTLAALCGTRIYWQPFSNHLEAYLNREIALGILAMVALREYTDTYGVTTFALIEIGAAIFLPPIFHVIRWTKENYHKHRDSIHSAISSQASKLSRRTSSIHSQSQRQSQSQSQTQSQTQTTTATAASSRARIASGLKGSIEKLNTSARSGLRGVSRKASMVHDEATPFNPDRNS